LWCDPRWARGFGDARADAIGIRQQSVKVDEVKSRAADFFGLTPSGL